VSRIAPLALALALGACAGAAQAGPPEALRAAAFAPLQPQAPAPRPDLTPVVRLADAPPARPAGVARTSLDAAFARDRAAASVGFLCGLDERRDQAGGMDAFGADPQGRFVGARLTLRLR
jgi:hypothetical protein